MVDNDKSRVGESEKILKVTLGIYDSYIAGLSSLRFLFEILEIQKNNLEKFLTVPDFFNYLYGVSYSSVIINLSNILVDSSDSINIYYLSSLLENHFHNNRNIEVYKDLHISLRTVLDGYSKSSEFYIGLKELRDKYVAHIDKKRFQTARGPLRKISIDEIECAFDSIGSLVGELIGTLGINPDLIEFENPDIASFQFRLLINSLNSNPKINSTSLKLEA